MILTGGGGRFSRFRNDVVAFWAWIRNDGRRAGCWDRQGLGTSSQRRLDPRESWDRVRLLSLESDCKSGETWNDCWPTSSPSHQARAVCRHGGVDGLSAAGTSRATARGRSTGSPVDVLCAEGLPYGLISVNVACFNGRVVDNSRLAKVRWEVIMDHCLPRGVRKYVRGG